MAKDTQTKKPRLRAAIYTRVSRDFSGRHRAVERQEEDCRLMCEVRDWEVTRVYSDNSISAYSGKTRPEYEKMLRDYRHGRFDVIVTWKLDRLVRNIDNFRSMVKEVQEERLRICTSDLGEVDLADAGMELSLHLHVSVAQFESRRKSERSKRANQQRAQLGYIKRGTRCFGFGPDLNVIEDEAECVRKMYEAYAHGASMSAIARNIAGDADTLDLPHFDAPSVIFARERWERMTDEQRANLSPRQIQMLPRELFAQIPEAQLKKFKAEDRQAIVKAQAKPEKKFDLAVTQQILKNPRYAGYVCYVPTIKGKCQSTNSHWTDFIVRDETGEPVKAAWPAIVEQDLWWQVQDRRDKNRYAGDGHRIDRNGSKIRHVGSGFYLCHVCGEPVKAGHGCYKCVGHVNRVRTHIDRYVLAAATLRLSLPESFDLSDHANDDEIEDLRSELADVRSRLKAVRAGFESTLVNGTGAIDEEMYLRVSTRLTERIAGLESKLQSLTTSAFSPLATMLEDDNPATSFMRIKEISQVQAILKQMMDVTLYKHLEGKRYNRETLLSDVGITWKLLPSPEHMSMSEIDRSMYASRLLMGAFHADIDFDAVDEEDLAPWARDLRDAPDFVFEAAHSALMAAATVRAVDLTEPYDEGEQIPTFTLETDTDPNTGETVAVGGISFQETDDKNATLGELLKTVVETGRDAGKTGE